ncbi:hypothetical protein MTP02_01650 [Streptomyces albus]|nr:hypothetical protein MTP02_01650 [Streptomyces albus]
MAHAHPHPDANGRAGTKGVRDRVWPRPRQTAGSPGSWVHTGAMRVSSILVDNTEHPAAGILTPGSTRAVRLPDIQLVSGVPLDSALPGHSGGTVPDSHRLPCTAGLRRDYIVGRPTKSRAPQLPRRRQQPREPPGRDRAPTATQTREASTPTAGTAGHRDRGDDRPLRRHRHPGA